LIADARGAYDDQHRMLRRAAIATIDCAAYDPAENLGTQLGQQCRLNIKHFHRQNFDFATCF
jgi:hypothetical protein